MTGQPTGRVSGLSVKDGNGTDRQFEIIVTSGYQPTKPVPVVLLFHGNGGDISGMRSLGFQTAIEAAGDQGIVVIPQGIGVGGWGVGWDSTCKGHDMPFVEAMLKHVSDRYCVSPSRVFASGFSWGGDMTHDLSCCLGSKLRGVAPIAGGEMMNASCPASGSRPAAWIRYGTASGSGGDGAYSLAALQGTALYHRNAQQCSATSVAVGPGTCRAYQNCKAPVIECAEPTMGHEWHRYAEVQAIWDFWRKLP